MSNVILHVTSKDAWTAAQKSRWFSAVSLSQEGFIHCSTTSQVLRVANQFFAGQHGLVLLVIDPQRLSSSLRWEPGVDIKSELFPHIYGPINMDAIMGVHDFEPDGLGRFTLPASLDLITNNE